jgi:uncharacterized protein
MRVLKCSGAVWPADRRRSGGFDLTDVLRAESHEWARDEAIRLFLRSHPQLVRDDPQLMQDLGVRPDAANIVDFGPVALSRVARAHRQESTVRRRLERVARANFDAQAQVHEAVIELIGAESHDDLAARLDRLARARFGLAAAVIALEGPEHVPDGWRALAEGQCDLALGQDKPARLGVLPTAGGLFAGEPSDIGSVALIRITLWTPARVGLLAFGAASDEAFSPDMGRELIDFLARVVERTAERWLAP